MGVETGIYIGTVIFVVVGIAACLGIGAYVGT